MNDSQFTAFLNSPHFDNAIEFDSIKPKHFKPAMHEAISIAKKRIEKIKLSSLEPNFINTFVALESCDEELNSVSLVFSNYNSLLSNEEIETLAQELYPLLSEFYNDFHLDLDLFKRVKKAFENEKENSNRTSEEKMLMDKVYKSFVRNGAELEADKRETLKTIDKALSKLAPKFSENCLKSMNQYKLIITDKNDLNGLPESAVESAKQADEEKWIFSFQMPSYVPFMTYCENRDLRKELYLARAKMATEGEFSNQKNCLEIVRLRQQRANLLGYKTHADYVLEERMAKTPDAVLSFLNKLLNPSLKKAKMELSELYTFAKELDNLDELQPWDIAYYREKLKQKNFTIDTESLKPYFSLNNVLEGIFKHCQILYQLNFKAVDFIPVYHSEVKTYQVYDNDNNYIGLFYLDLFPRDSKKPGAWMNSFREQGLQQNEVKRPHVIVVCNLTPPTKTKPSLLSLDEVETLFHEFGHALHGLLAKGTYSQVTGTNVKWDFVELPSQIFENWVKEEESLKLFAKHYLTEELLPLTWIEKIKDSAKFFSGYDSLRQLRFGLLDMAWHNNSNTDAISDVIEFEHQALQSLDLLPQIDNSSISTAFMHIFSGGYSAGYYSYKWAEVLDADAFSYFKEKGIFNPEVAKLFKTQILEKGSTEPPMDLYVKFRGQEPNPDALLKREGLC